MQKIKLFLIRSSLFLASLALSITASEFILNQLLSRFQVPYTYVSVENRNVLKTSEAEMRRHENVYELYKSLPSNLEILAIGDSFTNGGNVGWEQSYPFQLFEKLEKKYPVSNMGICEDTTKGTYMRLNHYFQHKKDQSKKSIVVVMVGAADMFYETSKEFESFYKEFVNGEHISSESISFKIEDNQSFFSKLKTVKMIKYVYERTFDGLFPPKPYTGADKTLATRLQPCFDSSGYKKRNACFERHLGEIKSGLKDGYSQLLFKRLLNTILSSNLRDHDGSEERIVGDLLSVIGIFPRMLAVPEVLYNLASYSTLQSHYSLELDILPLVKHITTDDRDFFDEIEKNHDQINKSTSILKSIEKWSSYGAEARKIQTQYQEKIIELVQKERGEIIFLTYPVDYKNINSAILKLENNQNVHVVDVSKIFSKLIKSGVPQNELIGDWEHCTPKGYDVIASSVLNKIQEISRRSKKNLVSY